MNERISPLDGRYASSIADLLPYFSETALMRYRLKIEIEYLIALSKEKSIKELSLITKQQQAEYRKIYLNFNNAGAKKLKKLKAKQTTMLKRSNIIFVKKLINHYILGFILH